MLQSSMHECIMRVTNLKLHHDWREDWAGAHMRRVGNNWRITLRMRYKEKARGEVLEHMVLHGTMNLVVSLIYCQKDTARGALRQKMKQSWNYTRSSMLPI